ncbi:hypothetical protein K1719_035867 [Acacia pycnantha]|nr:hypothetical protein K1719_035867 [Acacia pycnantha]
MKNVFKFQQAQLNAQVNFYQNSNEFTNETSLLLLSLVGRLKYCCWFLERSFVAASTLLWYSLFFKLSTLAKFVEPYNFFSSDFDEEDSGTDVKDLNTKTISRGGKYYSHSKSAASSYRWKIRHKKSLPDHLSDQSDDEPLDLLDRQKTISALKSWSISKGSQD